MLTKISIELASRRDRAELAKFRCGDESEEFVRAVHSFVRERALDDYLTPGTEIELVAISSGVQGDRINGTSVFRSILAKIVEDVVAHDRGDLVCFVVHDDNDKMLGMVRAAGRWREHSTTWGHTVFEGPVAMLRGLFEPTGAIEDPSE